MNEILDLLQNPESSDSESEVDIYIEPPDVRELTDENSGDENISSKLTSSNLSGNQLRAGASISDKNKECTSDVELDDDIPLSKIRKTTAKSYKWTKKCTFGENIPIFPEQNVTAYRDFSPVELFELFFDEDLLDLIIEQSTLYASQKNFHESNISKAELKTFLSILIISGYVPLSSIKHFWKNSDDLRNVAVYNSMRRNKFEYIKKILHFQDNQRLNNDDKYS